MRTWGSIDARVLFFLDDGAHSWTVPDAHLKRVDWGTVHVNLRYGSLANVVNTIISNCESELL